MVNIIIIKRISRTPIYHTKWEHRALYSKLSNTNHTHTHTHSASDEGIGRAVKNCSEKILNRCVLRAALKEESESEWRNVCGKLFQTDGPA